MYGETKHHFLKTKCPRCGHKTTGCFAGSRTTGYETVRCSNCGYLYRLGVTPYRSESEY